jgi:ATP-binding cassette subfamily B multidrug efflux pump
MTFVLATGFILIHLMAAVLHYFRALIFNHVAINVIRRLRCDLMNIALRLPLSSFDSQPVGQMIARITSDTEVIKNLYVTAMVAILRSAAVISTVMVAMFTLNWHMALIVSSIIPLVVAVMIIYQHYSIPIARRVRSHFANINSGFNEVINGMSTIQQFCQQSSFGKRISRLSQLHYLARMDTLRLDGFLLRPLLNLILGLILCGLLLTFSLSPVDTFEVGVLYAFITYLTRLNEPLIELITQQSVLQQAMVSGERIFELIDSVTQEYGNDHRRIEHGHITISNLSFSYTNNYDVLKKISTEISPGSFTALVGCTGSGKSTVASLLMGYYPVNRGMIRLDGRPIQQLTREVLREDIAIVQQNPVIIADTLLANICLGRDINEDLVWSILSQVKLDQLVKRMPNGIHTMLTEQGGNLSAGQRQLLSLARVLVKLPRILILDEATSNIDSTIEQAIQEIIQKLRRCTTLIVIAHRLSTIMNADNILVLRQGKIVEQGKHHELLINRGLYWQMNRLQQASRKLT